MKRRHVDTIYPPYVRRWWTPTERRTSRVLAFVVAVLIVGTLFAGVDFLIRWSLAR